jgi:hypothetical protein
MRRTRPDPSRVAIPGGTALKTKGLSRPDHRLPKTTSNVRGESTGCVGRRGKFWRCLASAGVCWKGPGESTSHKISHAARFRQEEKALGITENPCGD